MAVHRFEVPEQTPDEADRLAAITGCGIDFSRADPVLEDIVVEAAQVLSAPIALISIVQEFVQRFVARVGLDASETARNISFCGHALHGSEPLVIPDATLDPRFAGNPLVIGPPHIRAYFGAPLISKSGHVLGTLCVIDIKPRHLTVEQLALLVQFATRVVDRLEQVDPA